MTFTVFCQEVSGNGTMWIAAVEASSADEAGDIGQQDCASSWGFALDDVRVLGVAEGDVKMVFWHDE